MTINKIDEFAKNGDKSISGLTLTAGFPLKQKPFRQWFNWILNDITKKTNEIVSDVNSNSQSVIDNANAISNLDAKVLPLFEPIQVGELFVTTNDYQSPQDVMVRHGYGTWARYAEGRTLVGYSSQLTDPASYKTMGNEFGANTHTLSKNEMPKHKHAYSASHEGGSNAINDSTGWFSTNTSAPIVKHSESNADGSQTDASGGGNALYSEGGDQPHNNIQPSIVVAYWLRTA